MPEKVRFGFRTIRIYLTRFVAAIVVAAMVSVQPALAAEAHHAMVVAEGDLAAKAGLSVLEHGGNAVDAAVATELALGVTNATSCGLGGGGFMLIYWAKTHKLYALDYRERAPMAATPSVYTRNGKPDEHLARIGPLSVGVPGEAAGMEAALKRFGTMKFSQVAAPAIKLARDGFPLGANMAREIVWVEPKIKNEPGFRSVYFTPAGVPLKTGQIVKDPKYAALLQRLGNHPVKNFYHGAVAKEIIGYLKAHGGIMTTHDLAEYQAIWREPIHIDYHSYEVYTVPPPSSGGVLLEMLGALAPGHLAGLGLNSPPYLARVIEVMRQGFVDRALYADPAFVHVPIAKLLSPQHIAELRERAMKHAPAPPSTPTAHDHGTSNYCIVDRYGNVVDTTTTINTIFGSKMMVAPLGLILNDEMDDFGVAPGIPNVFRLIGERANEIAPGKRPLSSMAPVIALKDGHPALVAGGSGGPTILTGVLQVVLDMTDFHLHPEQAVDAPRIHEQAEPNVVVVEKTMPAQTIEALRQMGYRLRIVPHLGAESAIEIEPGLLRGAFDPRKGGGAVGN